MDVSGHVAPGFETVAQTFAAHRDEVGEGGAAFAATIDGVFVADLWAGRRGEQPWGLGT